MASRLAPAIPTYTLPAVDALVSSSRPPRLIPWTIAISLTILVTVISVAGICQYGNSKRGVIFREDIEDTEDYNAYREEHEEMEDIKPPNLDSVPALAPIKRKTLPEIASLHHTLGPDDSLSARGVGREVFARVQPTAHLSIQPSSHEHSDSSWNDSFTLRNSSETGNSPPQMFHQSVVTPSNRWDHDSYFAPSEHSGNFGYGAMPWNAPSRLDLGSSVAEGSVTYSQVMDRRISGDPY